MSTDTQETLSTETNVRPETENTIRPTDNPRTGGMDESNNTLGIVDIGTLLKEPEEQVPWIVDGYLARGSFTLVGGPPKLGTTTLAYDAIVSVATGQPFLGRTVTQAKVLILAVEEHKRDVVGRFRGYDEEELGGNIKVKIGPIWFHESVFVKLEEFIKQEEIGLVVVDTLHAWWQLSDENDAAEVVKKGMPLVNLIRRTNAAWLGIVHTRKSGGDHGHEIRGSSAIVGLVDIAISMKLNQAGGNQRLLDTVSRYADTPAELVIKFGDDGYEKIGEPEEVSAVKKAEKVLEALTEDWQPTQEELASATGLSKQAVSRAITKLGHKVIREGQGHKSDPYRYRRNSICPSTHSESETLDESNSSNEDEAVVPEQELTHV